MVLAWGKLVLVWVLAGILVGILLGVPFGVPFGVLFGDLFGDRTTQGEPGDGATRIPPGFPPSVRRRGVLIAPSAGSPGVMLSAGFRSQCIRLYS